MCRCGSRMRRNKWHKNKKGEVIYGYQCYNQLNNGARIKGEQSDTDAENACNLRSICDWKLEMMARHIFSGLWGNRQDILEEISSLYKVGAYEKLQENIEAKAKLEQEISKLDEKMKRLTRMRLDDEISKTDYFEYKAELEKDRDKLMRQKIAIEAGIEVDVGCESAESKMQNFLLQKMDFTEHTIARDIISQFVSTVIPRTETCFEWYLDFVLVTKPNEKKKMVWEFLIDFKEARAYRKEKDEMLRPTQWNDIEVKVYI